MKKFLALKFLFGICFFISTVPECLAVNVLVNPDFEEGCLIAESFGGAQQMNCYGWNDYCFPSVRSGTANESNFKDGRGGAAEYHLGENALRVYGVTGKDREVSARPAEDLTAWEYWGAATGRGEVSVAQTVTVPPNAKCDASVWVRTRDLDGSGFGGSDYDFVELSVEEFDSLDHSFRGVAIPGTSRSVRITKANSAYEQLSIGNFITSPRCVRMRYRLSFCAFSGLEHGACSFDDCALNIDDASFTTVTGKVIRKGSMPPKPLEGVTVKTGGRKAATNQDGVYRIALVASSTQPQPVFASGEGFFTQRKDSSIAGLGEVSTIDFELESVEKNLLENPGFERAVSAAEPIVYAGESGLINGWTWAIADHPGAIREESARLGNGGQPPPLHEPLVGLEACRHWTEMDLLATPGLDRSTVSMYQKLAVEAGAEYIASVWVKTRSFNGQGFGSLPGGGESAGLRVQEVSASGDVLVDHPKAEVTATDNYVQLKKVFTTDAKTDPVMFILESMIGFSHDLGFVTYDDCVFTPCHTQEAR